MVICSENVAVFTAVLWRCGNLQNLIKWKNVNTLHPLCCHGCTLMEDSLGTLGGFLALAWTHPQSQMLWSVLLLLELILRSWTL